MNLNFQGEEACVPKAAERKEKSRALATTNVIKAVFDILHTQKQQVLALRKAMISHKDLCVHSASAGLLLNDKLFFICCQLLHLLQQRQLRKEVIQQVMI